MPRPPDAADLLAYAGWLHHLARELTSDTASADDLAQDTYLAALAANPSRDQPLRPWLSAVARNLARLRARGLDHRLARERIASRAESLPATVDLVERAELQRLVVDLVLAQREPYRSTLLLRFYEGIEPTQIARLRDVPASTVRSQLKRGIDMLRAELDERTRGGRRAWCAVLAPITAARATSLTHWIGGLLVKSWTVATAAALATAALFFALRSDDAPRSIPHAADEPALSSSASSAALAAIPSAPPTPIDSTTDRRPLDPTPSTARVQGILLDASNDEPISSYPLTLRRDDSSESLITDSAGRFASALPHAGGTFQLELAELRHPNDLVQVRRAEAEALRSSLELAHAPPFTPHELRIATGPTLRFVLSPAPSDVDPRAFTATLTCADRSQAFDRAHAPLRDGELPWARFGATARLLSGGPPWRVAVRSDDGLWSGDAELTDLDAASAAPIHIELAARGRVVGRVLDAEGAAIASQWVVLAAEGAEWSSSTHRPVASLTSSDGRFEHAWIAPGRYALSVEREGFLPYRVELEVEAERSIEADVELTARPADTSAFLRGTVRSASGRYAADVNVRAIPSRSSPTAKRARVEWSEEAGELVGHFAFESLEPFEHRLALETPDLFLVEPAQLVALPGTDALEFRIDDAHATRSLGVRARDEATGAELETFLVLLALAPDGSNERLRQTTGRAGLARFDGVPLGHALELRVRADGYAPAWLDFQALPESGALELSLASGWGVDLRAIDVEGRPLAGVAIALDGEPAGSTDARGRLRATCDAAPSTLQAVHGDWVQAPTSGVDRETGRFRAWEPNLRVVLMPPQAR